MIQKATFRRRCKAGEMGTRGGWVDSPRTSWSADPKDEMVFILMPRAEQHALETAREEVWRV